MIHRDPKCVFVSDTAGLAEVIVTWLADKGIAAELMDFYTRGGLEGLTAYLPGRESSRGLEVWVKDPADVERARALLAEHEVELQKTREARESRTGTVDVVCEECGETCSFPAKEQGTVQSCVHCGEYMDVPDPEESWSEDVEEEEPEA